MSLVLRACSSLNLPCRLFSTSSSSYIRKITIEEDEKTIKVSGKKEVSPRRANLIDPSLFASASCSAYENCHPLCKFDKVHEIKHTDVLILEQFTDNNGDIIDIKITGLCQRQHYRMNKLIGMAQKAGLMGFQDKYFDYQTFAYLQLRIYIFLLSDSRLRR